MDGIVILYGIGAFIAFLVVHVIVFRMVLSAAVIRWLVVVVAGVGLAQTIILAIVCSLYVTGLARGILLIGASLWIYAGLVYVYVNVVLGLALTSVRMHMLLTIMGCESKGIGASAVSAVYNRNTIIRTRLSRLVESGELTRKDSMYRIGKRWSVFRFYGGILRFVFQLYETGR